MAKLPSPLGIFSTASQTFRDFYLRKIGTRSLFTLSPVSSHFIRGQLMSLDPKKATGLDDISSLFLRDGAAAIVNPVTHIINMSILTETVPAVFKEAKVIPMYNTLGRLPF